MRAVVCDRYGPPDVLRVAEVPRPVPQDDEVLIRVRATTMTRSDCECRAGYPVISRLATGLVRPKWRTFGYEVSGVVEAAGNDVTEFGVGDEVFGAKAGLSRSSFGAHAEFLCMRESSPLAHKPTNAGFEEAAAVCDGAILALTCLRPADLRKRKKVLIYGASGSIGTAAVQLSKYFDADVTGVCDTKNLELVKSLGADRVIDYAQEDFTRNGETYDVVYDAVGKQSFNRCKGSLERDGVYLATDHLTNVVRAFWTARTGGKKVLFPIPPKYTKEDVLFIKELMEAGRYRAVIDRSYPLADVVEAARYVDTHQKTGNVVLTVG